MRYQQLTYDVKLGEAKACYFQPHYPMSKYTLVLFVIYDAEIITDCDYHSSIRGMS